MTCPACYSNFPLTATVRGITVCGNCQRTIVVATGQLARAADTLVLTQDELKDLRKLRAQARASA